MTDRQTDGRTGKNNMSPDPEGGDIINDRILGIIAEKKSDTRIKQKPNPIGTYSKNQTKPFYIGMKEASWKEASSAEAGNQNLTKLS